MFVAGWVHAITHIALLPYPNTHGLPKRLCKAVGFRPRPRFSVYAAAAQRGSDALQALVRPSTHAADHPAVRAWRARVVQAKEDGVLRASLAKCLLAAVDSDLARLRSWRRERCAELRRRGERPWWCARLGK